MKKNEFCCEECLVHREIVDSVCQQVPDDAAVENVSGLFKLLGDNTRLKILFCLLKSEMCVCDLSELLQMGQSAISHQLRLLRGANLVKTRRQGKSIFYSIADSRVCILLSNALASIAF